MKYDILNRFTGAIQVSVEIDTKSNLDSIRLGLAVKAALKIDADLSGADLSGADLSGADLSGANLSGANLRSANLSGAYLSGADLSGADLRSANFSGADLSGANLRGAYLRGAYLRGAYLRGAYLSGDKINKLFCTAVRSDGYSFFGIQLESGVIKVLAGCRWFTISQFRAHTTKEYLGYPKFRETNDILDFIEARAKSL